MAAFEIAAPVFPRSVTMRTARYPPRQKSERPASAGLASLAPLPRCIEDREKGVLDPVPIPKSV